LAALPPGTHFGPYELVAVLGAGGMGDVYRARDTRLDRDVAVKVLPAALSDSASARERFARESRTVAALQHPNICVLHDVGETDGRRYLVMELLQGETLELRLARGALDVAEIVGIGSALADALEAAHAAGIVHRDIKPANIFLTARGPKVLDFGIATWVCRPAAADATTIAANATSLTKAGMAIGTVAYMSPEQLRGEPLDARTDLFSLGLVLYEMAIGRRAFEGQTESAIAAGILHDEPKRPSERRPELPPGLDNAILKALEKDRELRYQTAGELRADLKKVARDSAVTSAVPHPTSRSPARTSHRVVTVAILLAVLALAAWLARWKGWDRGIELFANYSIDQITNTGMGAAIAAAAISPDGRDLMYAHVENGLQSLRLRNISTGSDAEILGPAPVVYASLAFSPDGNHVFVRKTEGQTTNILNLYRIPVLGGTPQLVMRDIDTNISFSPDGSRFTFARANAPKLGEASLITVRTDGSAEQVLVTIPLVGRYTSTPAWSPDGESIAFTESYADGALGRLTTVDVATRQRRVLFKAEDMVLEDPVWSPDRRLLLVRFATQRRALLQWQIGAVTPDGTFRAVTNDTSNYIGFRVAGDGRSLVMVQRRSEHRLQVLPGSGGPPAAATELVSEREPIRGFTWTPEGSIVYARGNRLLRRHLGGGEEAVFVSEANSPPQQPADCGGRSLVFIWPFRDGDMAQDIWRVEIGGGAPVRLTRELRTFAPACSHDGQLLAYTAPPAIKWMPVGGGTPTILSDTLGALSGGDFSADDKIFAAIVGFREPTGTIRRKVALITIASNAVRLLDASPDFSGGDLRFTPDGQAVAYAVRHEDAANLRVQPLDGSEPRIITAFEEGQILRFSWSPDGARLALLRERVEADVVLLRDTGR
jgi:serine/threonine protein kinase/dipeptidyl aminopeptidase/acylaminoacyl peptidase